MYRTHQHKSESDDEHADERTFPPSESVSQRSEQIRADQIRDWCGQKCGSLLKFGRVHGVHHENGQRRLEHGDAHISEGNRSGGDQDVRIRDESSEARRVVLGLVDGRLKDKHLEAPVQQRQEREDEKWCRFADELVHEAAERGSDKHAEGQSAQRNAHCVASFPIVRVTLGQHAHSYLQYMDALHT